MLFGVNLFIKQKNCNTATKETQSCTTRISRDDLIEIYNLHLKRYIDQEVLYECEVQEKICSICREKPLVEAGESVLDKVTGKLNITIV